jgi:hypothetical protein
MLDSTRTATPAGLAFFTSSGGTKVYAEYGPDGEYSGHWLGRYANEDTRYGLFERGERTEYVLLYADGRSRYNGEACASEDPRLLALIEQVEPVEVRPAASAPHPPSAPACLQAIAGCTSSFCPRRRSRTPWSSRCTPTPPTVAGGRVTHSNNALTAKHDRANCAARAVLPFCRSGGTGGTNAHAFIYRAAQQVLAKAASLHCHAQPTY